MNKKEEIAAAITPTIESLGFYLEDLNITSAGRRSMLTVIVDGDTHLTLDQVTSVTKAIGEIVENIQSLGQTPFTLEVTSPGIDRPLTKPRHWKKNIDRLVKVVLQDTSEVKGRIKDSNQETATIDDKLIKFAEVKRATLEVEFKQAGK
jgi:ribosome maturation factor RimP